MHITAAIACLTLAYTMLILWYRHQWLRMPAVGTATPPAPDAPLSVSIVIAARNEEANIVPCLQAVLAQQYPAGLWQVIVVDDGSTDNTAQLVQELGAQYAHLQCIKLPAAVQFAHKKRAIEAGIAAASGQLVVCTDADCTMGPHWLAGLVQAHAKGAQFVAAPVMFTTKPTLLSIFQTLDFISLQGITGASVFSRFHTMCNGANIAYTKAAFEQVGGFHGIDRQPTGDDMLLMHKIYQLHPRAMVWLKSTAALVSTAPAHSWQAFFQQRIRWASKAAYYNDKRVFYVLLLVYIFNASLLLLGLASVFQTQLLPTLGGAIAIKTSAELSFMVPVARFFGKSRWLWWFPLMQPLHILYTVAAGWLGRFGSYQWKGRTVSSKQ